jgi:hypothetical protein
MFGGLFIFTKDFSYFLSHMNVLQTLPDAVQICLKVLGELSTIYHVHNVHRALFFHGIMGVLTAIWLLIDATKEFLRVGPARAQKTCRLHKQDIKWLIITCFSLQGSLCLWPVVNHFMEPVFGIILWRRHVAKYSLKHCMYILVIAAGSSPFAMGSHQRPIF